MKNYYKIMGVTQAATDAELKQIYRRKAKALHPDLNQNNPEAAAKLADVNEAYEILSDPAKRAEYDKQYNAALAQRAAAQNANAQAQGFAAQGFAAQNFGARPVPPQFNNPFAQYKAGFSTRFEAAAQAMANAQAMASAQARQQQMQIENAIKQSYNDGYSKGFADAGARVAEQETRYKSEAAALTAKIKSLEKELAAAEKDIAAQTEKLAEMIADEEEKSKNGTEKRSEKKEKKKDPEADRRTEFYKNEYETEKLRGEKTKEKLKDAEDRINSLETRERELSNKISALESANLELEAKIAEYEEYVQRLEADDGIDRVIVERELKLKEDKKTFKNTHYGALGVMFWAENEEIKQNYEKLAKKYFPKAESGDEKSREKLKKLQEAYSIISDAEKRAEYDKTLDITPEAVERERELERNYNSVIENYNRSVEEQEFRAYLDELTMLAQSGDDEAQNTLGELLYYGEDVENDYEQAAYWFKEAAKQQNPAALYNLGVCFLNGFGLEKDETKGVGFIKQAAKLNYKDAVKFLSKK